MSTKETVTSKDLNLHKDVAELSAKLQKHLTINADGTITPDKDLYHLCLPDDLSVEEIKKVQKFGSNMLTATAHAVGALASDFLKKHKNVTEVHLEKLHIEKDTIRTNYKRETQVSPPGGAPVTKYGWITAKLTTSSATTASAGFGRIRQHYAELGAAEFAGK
jgi:hypothetical protein